MKPKILYTSDGSAITNKDCVSDLCSNNCHKIVINVGKPICSKPEDKDPYDEETIENKETIQDDKIIEEDDYGIEGNDNIKVVNIDKPETVLDNLNMRTNIKGKIIDVSNRKPTGQDINTCSKILDQLNFLKVTNTGKITGKCNDNMECRDCIDAINRSILSDTKIQEMQYTSLANQHLFSDELIGW